MLDKKATEATIQILDLLGHSSNTGYFITVQTVILKHLETIYLQGRKDQVDRVNFEQLPSGALKFPDK